MSLTVKAYLDKSGKTEIRRFTIDEGASASYVYLQGKLTSVFPDLKVKPFSIFWKDAEGDSIVFSSDEELVEALGCKQGDIFKVYITLNNGEEPSKPSGNQEEPLHAHVVCDGCQGEVRGSRFKCSVCPDFDLCSKCEAKGFHQDHEMMRIRTPRRGGGWNAFQAFMAGKKNQFPPGAAPPPPPPPFAAGPCGFGPPPPAPDFGGQGPGGQGPPPFPGRHMRHWWRNMWRNYHQNGENGQPGNGPQPTNGQDGSTENAAQEEYLKNVGEQVAAMLDPLGIDVTVDVENPSGERKRCNNKGGPGGCKGKGKKQQAKTAEKPAEKQEEKQNGNAQAKVTKDEPAEEPLVKVEEETDGASGKSSPKEEVADGDWTVLMNAKPMQTPLKPDSVATKNLYPEIPPQTEADSTPQTVSTPQPAPTHPDKHIARALEQMKGMGFNDDGGWLTRLLEAKNGNISQVLDALQPNMGRH